jgi:hypothetical protein
MINNTNLSYAIFFGNYNKVKEFVINGEKITEKHFLDAYGDGNIEICSLLIDYGLIPTVTMLSECRVKSKELHEKMVNVARKHKLQFFEQESPVTLAPG